MRRIVTLTLICSPLFLTGCHIDTRDIGKIGDALDRFGATIKDTTGDGGNLSKRITQFTTELRKELVEGGKELTDYAALKFALEREKTIADILALTKKIFGDTRVLAREFQGIGLSIPLQLDDALKGFRADLKQDFAGLISAAIFAYDKKTPAASQGVTWSFRPKGFQTVTFAIKEAAPLKLKIGDLLISPENPMAGSVTYRIPFTPKITTLFDDTRESRLGFQLVDEVKKDGKDELTPRYGGFMRLTPLFPLKYTLTVTPAGNQPKTESRYIDSGPALDMLLEGAPGKGVAKAARQGAIYRHAETLLPVGTSFVTIPEGANWKLTVTFPDQTVEVLTPDKRSRTNNDFGSVTVSGPNQDGNSWSLMIDVELRK